MLSYQSSVVQFTEAPESDIVSYCEQASSISGCSGIRKLSPQVVAKVGFGVSAGEFWNQAFVFKLGTGGKLRIPRPLRYFSHAESDGVDCGYLLMEYVPGKTIEERLLENDNTMVDKTAEAISILHNRTLGLRCTPGPINGGRAQGFPWGYDGVDHQFESMEDLESFLSIQHLPCVLVHGDLAPRNFIASGEDEITLLDWASAAFYPSVFEVAGLFHLGSLVAPIERNFVDGLVGRLANIDVQSQDILKLERVHVISTKRLFVTNSCLEL